ncbi:MAG: hypothetical protein ACLVEN_03820 [Anaerotignum lactatifermentans]|uniref:hypothetical protein n=1 Tax=Anaerotignum lactatifermentans TaxID=160404 RepID=UPI00399AAEF5
MDKINQLFIETLKKAEQEGKNEYVFAAIWSLMKEIRGYHDKGFMEKILFQIARKKLDFLMVAKSRKEVNEILRPSLPVYNGNTFLPNGPFHVDEEELVIWSIVSIKAPLNHEGFMRYHLLFKRIVEEQYL